MKRSEAIKKLMTKVVSPFEVISKDKFDSGEYERRAKDLLDFIEKDLGMTPPFTGKIEQQDILDRWSISTGKTAMVRVLVNEWEPE